MRSDVFREHTPADSLSSKIHFVTNTVTSRRWYRTNELAEVFVEKLTAPSLSAGYDTAN